ncbi:ATP-binding protein [Streptomyces hoynatensis]|uniref:XRE family transcriptional regulator n=1 Tax=Streptomyces hoynatensis TaxID=1141874 RepID=A0A3A9YJR7_9ACTN|nr:NB-ARC domain-containing protein [Streptomyces hoynatensis]RKN37008.1 XRE family transcriptional regulator [Streptomyces hoynatensis]
MELLSATGVLSAVESVTSDLMSQATGEAGRRISEALAGLVRRLWRRGGEPGGSAPPLPESPEERRELARRLLAEAERDPEFARDLGELVREASFFEAGVRGGARRPLARPLLLPPGTTLFTDRERVLAEIAGIARAPRDEGAATPVIVLLGPGGIGKTATAVQAARALAGEYPDGQLYADLRGASAATALSPSEVHVRFLHGLGVPQAEVPADGQRQQDLYRDCLADRRVLVLLDNAHSAAQVAPLLPASPGSLVLVTSRHRMPELLRDFGARPLRLEALSADDSLRLLGRLAGERRVERERPFAELVAGRCGGLPLALCATGARLAEREHLTWERVAGELAAPPEAGREPGSGQPDPALLAADASYAELGEAAARLYRRLALRPWPAIPVGAAAAAAEVPEEEARALLEELAAAHLVEEVAEERYRFHDVVRRHALGRARRDESPREAARAVARMIGWFLREAAAADFLVIPGRWRLGPAFAGLTRPADAGPERARAALDWLRRERDNLAEAVAAADDHGFDDLAWQLCEAMWALHLRLGFHEQWAATHRRGAAAAARRAAEFGDPRAEGRMRVQLAFALMGLGQFAEADAELQSAAAAEERARHPRGLATALEVLGLLRLRQWRHAEAQELFERAAETLRGIRPGEDGAADAPRALAILTHHAGRALAGQDRGAEALGRLREARARFAALDQPDRYNEARVGMSLGEVLLAAGDPAAAAAELDLALAVLAAEGADLQRADAAELRAACARRAGDAEGAAAWLRVARDLHRDLGNRTALARLDARLSGE